MPEVVLLVLVADWSRMDHEVVIRIVEGLREPGQGGLQYDSQRSAFLHRDLAEGRPVLFRGDLGLKGGLGSERVKDQEVVRFQDEPVARFPLRFYDIAIQTAPRHIVVPDGLLISPPD